MQRKHLFLVSLHGNGSKKALANRDSCKSILSHLASPTQEADHAHRPCHLCTFPWPLKKLLKMLCSLLGLALFLHIIFCLLHLWVCVVLVCLGVWCAVFVQVCCCELFLLSSRPFAYTFHLLLAATLQFA